MKAIINVMLICPCIFLFSCSSEDDPLPSCTDGIQNGTEIGVDCGGDCDPCFTCSDGIQNGEETGVDCGGDCPSECYGIGLTGQAGGIIFFDKGEFTDGWQYLEAAPVDLDFDAFWDCYGVETFAREIAPGEGDLNLETVRQFDCFAMSSNPNVVPAMLQSHNYSYNDFTDWYLPTFGALQEMYLLKDEISGLSDAVYWSSSEMVNDNVRAVDMSNGNQATISKQKFGIHARAIRKF